MQIWDCHHDVGHQLGYGADQQRPLNRDRISVAYQSLRLACLTALDEGTDVDAENAGKIAEDRIAVDVAKTTLHLRQP